jgi:hypothetical protein
MSALDRVRAKFKSLMSGTGKTSISPSASFAGSSGRHSETSGTPFAGSAGSVPNGFGIFEARNASGEAKSAGTPGSYTASDPLTRMDEMTQEFTAALRLGCLKVCAHCKHFQMCPGNAPDGWCSRYRCETWSRVPFSCDGYRGMH